MLVQPELGRAHTRAAHTLGGNLAVLDGQAAKGAFQRVKRQPEIEQCAEDHVTRGAGETV
jgi:hypothetical protein